MKEENVVEIDTEKSNSGLKVPPELITLKNWSVYGSYWVGIEIYKIQKPKKNEDDAPTYTYNPTLAISLDSFELKPGEVPNLEDQKIISVSMDRYFTEAKVAAIFAFQFVKELFARVSVNVFVYDDKHVLIEQFDLNSFVEQGEANESA